MIVMMIVVVVVTLSLLLLLMTVMLMLLLLVMIVVMVVVMVMVFSSDEAGDHNISSRYGVENCIAVLVMNVDYYRNGDDSDVMVMLGMMFVMVVMVRVVESRL